jgi:hypothetical protein
MANVLKSLKEKFPDLYSFLLENQNENNIIFFGPNKLLYAKDSLNNKSFYYNHIFKKSEFDSNLYTNFIGKVIKYVKDKTYETYLGWENQKTITVIEDSTNADGIFFFQTDSVCTDEPQEVVKYSDKQSIPLMKYETSSEYLTYYSNFNIEDYKDFQIGMGTMKSFIFSILNNYMLLKGYEENYSQVIMDNMKKFISAYEIIFKDKSPIASEFVDSFIFPQIYDKIVEKFDNFYSQEQKDLKNKIIENIHKYDITEFKLDESLLKCNFDETYEKINKLKKYKTIFEKKKCLNEINESMLNEVKSKYEKANGGKLDIQGDLMIKLWTILLANYIKKYDIKYIYRDYLFCKFFKIYEGKDKNVYIITNFIGAFITFENDLIIKNNKPQIELIKST